MERCVPLGVGQALERGATGAGAVEQVQVAPAATGSDADAGLRVRLELAVQDGQRRASDDAEQVAEVDAGAGTRQPLDEPPALVRLCANVGAVNLWLIRLAARQLESGVESETGAGAGVVGEHPTTMRPAKAGDKWIRRLFLWLIG